tara:strand:+ start:9118 stop:9675 length:558 start_codon:yes stop_codon:yes gene_type:complete
MIIGITLDEVIRDFSGKFREVYEKFTDNEIDDEEIEISNLPKYFSGDTETTIEFLYEEHPLELFGYANELFSNSTLTLKAMMENNPEDEFLIISKEHGRSAPSTLFFLSKIICEVPNIKFVTSFEGYWENVDALICADPRIMDHKPDDKILIKVNKTYNEQYKGDKNIVSLKEYNTKNTLQIETS